MSSSWSLPVNVSSQLYTPISLSSFIKISVVKFILILLLLQVAALAPLALLLVLEAHCSRFVIAHFNNILCCRVVHYCSYTAHIIYVMTNLSHVTKMCVNITVIAMGTVVPMSKVEGSWIWFYCYQVYVIQHLPIMVMYCNPHAHVHYTMCHSMKVVILSSLAVRSQDFRDDSPATMKRPKLIARRDTGCLVLCTL